MQNTLNFNNTFKTLLMLTLLCVSTAKANDCSETKKFTESVLTKLKSAALVQGSEFKDVSRVHLDFWCHWDPNQSLNAEAEGHTIHFAARWLYALDSEDEVAMILGHELAHIVLHHTEGVKIKSTPKEIRQKETDADEKGLLLMSGAGYSVGASISALEYLKTINHDSLARLPLLKRTYISILDIFPADHPKVRTRVKNLRVVIDENNLNCDIPETTISPDVKSAATHLELQDEENPSFRD